MEGQTGSELPEGDQVGTLQGRVVCRKQRAMAGLGMEGADGEEVHGNSNNHRGVGMVREEHGGERL